MEEKLAKVKAELERRIALYSGLSKETVNPNRIDEDRQILSFIDSMKDEQVKESLISKHEDKTCKENGDSLTQPVSEG